MSRTTRVLLLAGCACILVLEAPRTFAALADGWRGPYAPRAGEALAEALDAAASLPGEPELARR